jgi:hypothetical protein
MVLLSCQDVLIG